MKSRISKLFDAIEPPKISSKEVLERIDEIRAEGSDIPPYPKPAIIKQSAWDEMLKKPNE